MRSKQNYSYLYVDTANELRHNSENTDAHGCWNMAEHLKKLNGVRKEN